MRKITAKALSLLLCLALTVMNLTVIALADGEVTPPEGYTAWTDAENLPQGGTAGKYYLTVDVTINAEDDPETGLPRNGFYNAGTDITIDLMGHSIRQKDEGGRIFRLSNGASLTIEDSTATGEGKDYKAGVLYPGASPAEGAVVGIFVDKGSEGERQITTFTMNGGIMDGAGVVSERYGGGVQGGSDYARIVFNNGVIRNFTAKYGGAISGQIAESITINGGWFYGNTATTAGGAVSAMKACVVTVNGAEFFDNTADSGGALFCSATASMTVDDCVFYGNQARMGGTIRADGVDTTTIFHSCEIYGNKATAKAGAVMTNGNFKMTDGYIHDNEAGTFGGALSLQGKSEISGGTIINNYTIDPTKDGGVYVSQTGSLVLSGNVIIDGNYTLAEGRKTVSNLGITEKTISAKGMGAGACIGYHVAEGFETFATDVEDAHDAAFFKSDDAAFAPVYDAAAKTIATAKREIKAPEGYTEWNDPDNLPQGGTTGKYYLTVDVTINAEDDPVTGECKNGFYGAGTDITIDLMGHTIRQKDEGWRIFRMSNGANLTIEDSTAVGEGRAYVAGQLLPGPNPTDGGVIGIFNNATMEGAGKTSTLTINGGIMDGTGVTSEKYGGAIQAGFDSVRIVINGGVIRNFTSKYGGAISGQIAESIKIYGGSFYGNTATTAGGAISAMKACSVEIYNGAFFENTADSAGAIFVNAQAALTIEDGEFFGNEARMGGTFRADGEATSLYLYGGSIYGNKASAKGGAAMTSGYFKMVDGEVRDNEAGTFGGAFSLQGESIIKGGSVTGNFTTDPEKTGGVYLAASGSLELSGTVLISDNYRIVDGEKVINNLGITEKTITVTSLNEDSSIGFFTAEGFEEFATDVAEDCSAAFCADNKDLCAVYDAEKKVLKTVAYVAVTDVTVEGAPASLEIGGTATVKAVIAPDTATNQKTVWTSDNEAVLTVDNGVLTAVSAGTATVTVKTADGDKSAQFTVEVKAAETEPAPTEVPTEPAEQSTESAPAEEEDGVKPGLIIGIAAAVIVIAGGAVVLGKKKGKKE